MDFINVINEQQEYFNSKVTLSYNFRIMMLKRLKKVLKENESSILNALYLDLNKSEYEAYMTEVGLVYEELNYFIKNLRKLMKKEKVKTPIYLFPSKSYIMKDPYGKVLIISPWNYPLLLAISPLIGSIAGGNVTVLKLSEYSMNTSLLIEKIISENFDYKYIKALIMNAQESQVVLEQKYDKIFFTGSSAVGKIVYEAAAKNLCPVTLELGGKSPAIITKDFDLALAARRICFGKFTNSGQTCVAPDYLFVDRTILQPFLRELEEKMAEYDFNNENYPKIINSKHYVRLVSLLNEEDDYYGGKLDELNMKISPTYKVVSKDSRWLDDEIFGPILPILVYDKIEEAINYINNREKPLALYIFSSNKETINDCLTNVSFGGGVINDTLLHLSNINMLFGGVGASGLGMYHGKYSFSTFTHSKSVLKCGKFDLKLKYPNKNKNTKILRKFLG